MEVEILVVMGCIATIIFQLFILYQFYLLLKRFVIAKERQAGALERFAAGFTKPEDW